ncbi:unnamed protein product [Caenorhabditis bovis]|uniref:Centrosomal protein CEP104 N-terminal domain-containing protein n=1 Tax=Caenorhabditis bovis TaxID=2654633 RepID=A0A8S1ETK3_9PELO|nr:unnamed protein product [Caenorhabditis bovis]
MTIEYTVSRIQGIEINDAQLLVKNEWISEKDEEFPIDMEIELKKIAEVEKIEIVAHNFYIPKKIGIYSFQNDTENYIGEVIFKNRGSVAKKFELKNIFLDEKCSKLLLRIYEPYTDVVNNLESKVGIVELKLFGKYLPIPDELDNNPIPNNIPDRKYSKELSAIIDGIEANKQKAVANEDFKSAKSAQLAVRQLRRNLKEVEELENDKISAINDEDYQRANDLQDELNTLRANILASIDPVLLNNTAPRYEQVHRPKNLFGEKSETPISKPKLYEPVELSPTEVPADPSHTFVPSPKPPKSPKAKAWEIPISRPQTTSSVGSNRMKSSDSRRNISTASSTTSKILRRSSSGDGFRRTTNKFLEKENMIVPAALSRQRSASIQPEGFSSVNRSVDHLTEDQILAGISPDNLANVRSAISIFGLETIAKLYSKHFENRKEAISEIEETLNSLSPNKSFSYFESINCLLAHMLREPLYNVYRDALNLWHHVCTVWAPEQNLSKLLPRITAETHNVLASKVISNDKRTVSDTQAAFRSVCSKSESSARSYARDLIGSKSKNLKGRAILLNLIAGIYDIPNDKINLSDINVANFAAKCIRHSDQQVRSIGSDLMIRLFKNGSQSVVRKQLDTFATADANNPTYQKTLKQIYALDGGRGNQKKKKITFAF